MEKDFLDGVYWEEWYNKGDEDWPTKMPCSGNQIEFTDKKKGPKGMYSRSLHSVIPDLHCSAVGF